MVSDEAPLSVRAAMLVVMLADAVLDRSARAAGVESWLRARGMPTGRRSWRSCWSRPRTADGPRLLTVEAAVPSGEYGSLDAAVFMVSLVQRAHCAGAAHRPCGARRDVHEGLHVAVEAVETGPR